MSFLLLSIRISEVRSSGRRHLIEQKICTRAKRISKKKSKVIIRRKINCYSVLIRLLSNRRDASRGSDNSTALKPQEINIFNRIHVHVFLRIILTTDIF